MYLHHEKVYQISQSSLRKKANEQTVTSQSPKTQTSKKSKDAFSSSNEVYSISESSLRKNMNKQIVLTSSNDE